MKYTLIIRKEGTVEYIVLSDLILRDLDFETAQDEITLDLSARVADFRHIKEFTLNQNGGSRTGAFINLLYSELEHMYTKHGRDPWKRHEFFGILKEEVDELWDDIKHDVPVPQMLHEIVQVAAVCLRYVDAGDRTSGLFPVNVDKKGEQQQ